MAGPYIHCDSVLFKPPPPDDTLPAHTPIGVSFKPGQTFIVAYDISQCPTIQNSILATAEITPGSVQQKEGNVVVAINRALARLKVRCISFVSVSTWEQYLEAIGGGGGPGSVNDSNGNAPTYTPHG